jgi:N-acetylmuramoyl-L-alanine amidase
MRQIRKIIIHCTATPEGRATTVKEVDRWHRERGFSGIGYHYLTGISGEVWKGRPEEQPGAHCEGHNADSIGVCYVGGLAADGRTAKDTRTAAQRTALKNLVASLKRRYPAATVHGHREFARKECPSFDVQAEEW